MKKITTLAVVMGLGSLVPVEAAALTHYLNIAPKTNQVNGGCIGGNDLGGVTMLFNQGCAASIGGAWTSWRYAYISMAWAPNPGSTEGVEWSSTEPAGTQFAARTVGVNSDGTIASAGSWTYGGGWKSGYNDNGIVGDGVLLLEIGMRTQTAARPTLHVVSAQVYSY